MEELVFTFAVDTSPIRLQQSLVAGVVSSGNLEVLVETATGSTCQVHVATSAEGFGTIWQAVLADFIRRHQPAGLAFSLNDAGATPAIVSLRLDQAMAAVHDQQQDGTHHETA